MRLGNAWLGALALSLSLGVSGCIVDVIVDPIGQDASIAGSWTIEGAAPTAESCEALGITNVRVRFASGTETRLHPDLVFDCAAGSFDTRPRQVVADGTWVVQLVAINADGDQIAAGPTSTFDTIADDGHYDIPPVDFVPEVSVTRMAASWTINGATPDATLCGDAGIAEVWVEFLDAGGNPIDGETYRYACADGSFTEEIAPGDYAARIVAVDDTDTTLLMLMREDFTVAAGETFAFNNGDPIEFEYDEFDPRGMDVTLDSAWTIGKTTASDLACEVAGGTTVEFVLYAPDDTAREEGVIVAMSPCGSGIFGTTDAIIAAGTYLVSVVLVDAANDVVGRADFNEVTLDVGSELVLTDTDIRLADTTLGFEIEWEDPLALGTFGSCTDATVASMQWDVTLDGAMTAIYMSATTEDPCETLLVFNTASGEPITPGTYDLFIEGNDTAGKAWSLADPSVAPCQLTISDTGDLGLTASPQDCRMLYTP